VICLRSAVAYWDLSDEIPGSVDLAVPSGTHRPQIQHPPTRVHVFQATTFDLGRAHLDVENGVGFSISGIERTVVDCFRACHRIGADLAVGGLRRYLRRTIAKLGRLVGLAESLRERTPLLQAIELLQE
jgi:predicted transcriptional regulator of viral defense system